MVKKSLSVVIPNYNGQHLLEAYLPSVFQAVQKAEVPYEIIVIDDGSKDQSIAFIKEHYPQIRLLINDKNRGFSYTCNQGIKAAQYELTFLLNSDVRLTEDYFEQQWKYFQQEDTFGVMGRIMSADGSKIEDAARVLFRKGCRLKANRFYYSTEPNEQSTYTAYLSGANALVNTKKLKELGGFDEIYSPFSSEDSDLCLRAWLVGWKCYYEHESICYHQVSGSTKTQIKSDFIKKIYYRNRFIFHKIHLNGFRALIWPAYLLMMEVLPKVILGKLWMMTSYKEYLQHISKIKSSKEKIELLKKKYNSNLEVQDIINKINSSYSNKSVAFL